MVEHPYRRESLREVLLDLAEDTLRRGGVDDLSLREIARAAGVSHGAPRTHFADRAALLDALAARGYDRFADTMQRATGSPGDYPAVTLAVARSSVEFARANPGLLDLMFTAKAATPSPAVMQAAGRLFETVTALAQRGVSEGEFAGFAPERLPLLFSGTMQGISALIVSGHVPADQVDPLLVDTVAMFLGMNPAARTRLP